jgi:hypothetical protein
MGYPSDWEARRQALIRRSSNRCESCGIAAGTPVGKRKLPAVLQAAHLKPGDHRLCWLAYLCRGCHLALDKEQHLFNRRVNAARRLEQEQRSLFEEEE